MTEAEVNRAVQYATASTSYAKDTVSDIIRTGLGELASLALGSTQRFERAALLEYICIWTIKRTGHPEPLVREILGCAGRWLEAESARLAKEHPELFDQSGPSLH